MTTNHISDTAKSGFLAAGGALGAIGASSCCLLPLVFALTGISGAWIGSLARLAPYQPIFLGIAGLSVGFGFWRTYRRGAASCDRPQCGKTSVLVVRSVLWVSAVLIAVAGTTEWWLQRLA